MVKMYRVGGLPSVGGSLGSRMPFQEDKFGGDEDWAQERLSRTPDDGISGGPVAFEDAGDGAFHDDLSPSGP